jgi:hypothetical protein
MAAKFRTDGDPTGEATLKHWIALGQIQDYFHNAENHNNDYYLYGTQWYIGYRNQK